MTVGVSFVFVFFLLIIMIALAGLISLAIILYKASYRRYLDKRIAEHSLGKKKAKKLSPFHIAVICLLSAFFLTVIGFSALMIRTGLRLNHDDSVLNGCKTVFGFCPEFEHLKGYSASDEIPGYNRYTNAIGKDTLVYYIAQEPNAVSPQFLFCLDTDLPRYNYNYSIEIDGSWRLSTAGNYDKEAHEEDIENCGWAGFCFPFNFSDTKRYYSELHIKINGQEMLVLPLNDIAHGALRDTDT
ncbi:MAG: hypothetical protein IK134_13075 [Oscillospiraceae bacterium]|nr:hypothetical protein [Oscillospiraceae bacterium]